MSHIFEIKKKDKENFIQALHTIFNFDRNYPDEEREFIYQLKILLDISNFKPYTLDNEEKDLVKIIENIQNKDLIVYLFLIAEEAAEKQHDKKLYESKMQNLISKLSPEIKEIPEIKACITNKNISLDKVKEIGENLFNKFIKSKKPPK